MTLVDLFYILTMPLALASRNIQIHNLQSHLGRVFAFFLGGGVGVDVEVLLLNYQKYDSLCPHFEGY